MDERVSVYLVPHIVTLIPGGALVFDPFLLVVAIGFWAYAALSWTIRPGALHFFVWLGMLVFDFVNFVAHLLPLFLMDGLTLGLNETLIIGKAYSLFRDGKPLRGIAMGLISLVLLAFAVWEHHVGDPRSIQWTDLVLLTLCLLINVYWMFARRRG